MIQPVHLFAKCLQGDSIQLITDLIVIAPGRKHLSRKTYKALIDTGADHSGISPTVAKELKQIPYRQKADLFTAGGVVLANVYLLELELQCEKDETYSIGFIVDCSELPQRKKPGEASFDVLLGMDILGMSDLQIQSDNESVYCEIVVPGVNYNTGMRSPKSKGLKGYGDIQD